MSNVEKAQARWLWRRSKVLDATGLSKSGLYKKMELGLFPRPVSLSSGEEKSRSVAWNSQEVIAWIEARLENASPKTSPSSQSTGRQLTVA